MVSSSAGTPSWRSIALIKTGHRLDYANEEEKGINFRRGDADDQFRAPGAMQSCRFGGEASSFI